MGESAQVSSIAAIEDFRGALVQFAQQAAQSLCEMETEIRRAYDWLTHDQLKFWQSEFKRCGRALLEAKSELQNAQTSRRMDDYTPSCSQERKKVERIRQRQELAQAKIQAVRRWSQVVAREVDEFKTRSAQLSTMLEADVPKALSTLDRILLSLDAYVQLAAPAVAPLETVERGGATSSKQGESIRQMTAAPNLSDEAALTELNPDKAPEAETK
jgi:hypothetical protein